jgi:protein-disulfide isomerase
LLKKYPGRLKIAFKDFPLTQMHPDAQLAAEAARCSGDQGQFWQFHDRIYLDPSKMATEDLVRHAQALGLNQEQFESCLSSGVHAENVRADLQEGGRAGVSGTPSFFINGVFISGAQPLESFEAIIKDELSSSRKKQASWWGIGLD